MRKMQDLTAFSHWHASRHEIWCPSRSSAPRARIQFPVFAARADTVFTSPFPPTAMVTTTPEFKKEPKWSAEGNGGSDTGVQPSLSSVRFKAAAVVPDTSQVTDRFKLPIILQFEGWTTPPLAPIKRTIEPSNARAAGPAGETGPVSPKKTIHNTTAPSPSAIVTRVVVHGGLVLGFTSSLSGSPRCSPTCRSRLRRPCRGSQRRVPWRC